MILDKKMLNLFKGRIAPKILHGKDFTWTSSFYDDHFYFDGCDWIVVYYEKMYILSRLLFYFSQLYNFFFIEMNCFY